MNTDHLSKLKRIFSLLLLFAGVSMLTYCTSNVGRLSSSFGKRKYTRGHFSDPVGKVNTKYNNYNTPAFVASTPKKAETTKTDNSQTSTAPITAQTGQTVASDGQSANSKGVSATDASPATDNNGTSDEEKTDSKVSASVDYTGHGDHQERSSNKAGTYLLTWLICAALSGVCFLLLVSLSYSAAATGSAVGTGCLLVLLGTFAFIAAVVFFILWIIAMTAN